VVFQGPPKVGKIGVVNSQFIGVNMAVTLRASKDGLATVEMLRKRKDWTKTEDAWWQLALVGKAALRKFWRRVPIVKDNFVSICEIVGANWEEIADFTEENEVESQSEARWLLELKATVDETDKPLIENFITFSKERLGYPSVTWQSIAPGSEALIQDWQPVESVMPRGRSRSRTTEQQLPEGSVRRGKEIELGGTKVVLVAQITPVSKEEARVSIDVYPSAEDNYLPLGLEVAIVDETDAIIWAKKVETNKDSLQIELSIEPEELLSVRIALGEVSVTKDL
jgi:hypothetical protein